MTTALGFIRFKLFTISDKMNFGADDDGAAADLSRGILNIQKYKIWVFMERLSGSTGFGYKSNGQFSFLPETSNKKRRLEIGIYGRSEWHD